jgi:endonuclease/exonuclease/phosphatase family metal-dependent hydrolase
MLKLMTNQAFSLGESLKLPFFSGLEMVFNQLVVKNESLHYCQKISCIAKQLFGAAVAISSVPIYLVGGTLQLVSNLIHKFDFRLQKMTNNEIANKHTYKIATWNICLFDGGLSVPFGGLAGSSERISNIANRIIDQGPDIIALQEVGIKGCRMLKEKLKDYDVYYALGNSNFFFPSGITLLSKVHLNNVQYHAFKEGVFMKRGFLTFETDKFFGVTTHLQPGKANQEIRKRQLNEIKEKMQSFTSKPVMIFGDLNWQRPVELEGFTDLSIEKKDETATNLLKNFTIFGKSDDEPDNESIDTFLVINENRSKITNFSIRKMFKHDSRENLSDHHLISVEIS